MDERQELLGHALSAARNFRIFPVAPRGKVPALEAWQQAATQDVDQIREWFDQRLYNIGILTGDAGLVVVDLDDGHGQPPPERWAGTTSGRDVLTRLAHAAGQSDIQRTYTVSTPSGGSHLYYRAHAGSGLRNTIGTVGWRIDTRANGGYVVAAGSRRAEGQYRVVDPSSIAPLPDWLLAALTPPPPAPRPAPIRLPRTRVNRYTAAIVEQECAAVATAPTGTRHRTLLRAARILGELVGGGVLEETAAVEVLSSSASGHIGVDGCTAAEIQRTIADGVAYGKQRPRQFTGGQ